MNILVTGGAGLIGSLLVETLLDRGHTVHLVDDLSYGSMRNVEHCLRHPKLSHDFVDLVQYGLGAGKDPQDRDVVIHLAALKKSPGAECLAPSRVQAVNTALGEAAAGIASRNDAHLLFASTSDVYHNSATFSEEEPLCIASTSVPRFSYALSKIWEEQYYMNLYHERSLRVTILRLFGVYGPRSASGWSGGHIPVFIEKAKKHETIDVHGSGLQTRSMAHVSDIVRGFMLCLDRLEALNGDTINLGSGEEFTVQETASKVIELLRSRSKTALVPNAHGDYEEVHRRFANTEKAKMLLGWSCSIPFEQGLRSTIEDWDTWHEKKI